MIDPPTPLRSKCCDAAMIPGYRFCPKCGWDARVISTPRRISGEKEHDMDTRQSSPCPTSRTGSPRSQPDGSWHMPTPWHVGPYYTTDVESSRGRVCECSPLSAPTAIANAAFIVRACNSHADLLAAAKRSLDWLASYQGNAALPAYEQMRAAIAKAEGR
jgi:hypothetical protein